MAFAPSAPWRATPACDLVSCKPLDPAESVDIGPADQRSHPRVSATIEQVFSCTRKVSVNYYTAGLGAPLRTVVNEVVFTTAGIYGELKSLTIRDNLALSTRRPFPARHRGTRRRGTIKSP